MDVGTRGLNLVPGGTCTRLEVWYGFKNDGQNGNLRAPLHVNLLSLGDRFRIPFRQTDNRNINFVMEVWSNNYTKYSEGGKNLHSTKPFVAELPFDQFRFDPSVGGPDFSNVDAIAIIITIVQTTFTLDALQIARGAG